MSLRAPLFALIGVAIVGLAANLARVAPSPGELAAGHAAVKELEGPAGCEGCHGASGLRTACVRCHAEIAAQVDGSKGLHGRFAADGRRDCAGCHGEHYGGDYDLVNRVSWGGDHRDFRHPHVAFELSGTHAKLKCEQCHRSAPRSWLGLAQECRSCHANVHGAAMSDECGACHSQDSFRPAARFEHARRFPLLGVHAEVACERCHPAPGGAAPALDFKRVTGTGCRDCHATPHRAPVGDRCADCHRADERVFSVPTGRFGAADHARIGVALDGPHAAVACGGCHDPKRDFAGRYPGRTLEKCAACHASPHGGQFGAREPDCRRCHAGATFKSSNVTAQNHEPPLRERHRELACSKCHAPQKAAAKAAANATGKVAAPVRFVGTPQKCDGCHADPHQGQFRKSRPGCAGCHDETRFKPARFDVAAHAPPLKGAHLGVACSRCHVADAKGTRRFVGTAKECRACHQDPHAGQLTTGAVDCNRCHRSMERWLPATFDHETQSRFRLEGVHARLACSKCHLRERSTDGRERTHYKPLGSECRDCHVAR